MTLRDLIDDDLIHPSLQLIINDTRRAIKAAFKRCPRIRAREFGVDVTPVEVERH